MEKALKDKRKARLITILFTLVGIIFTALAVFSWKGRVYALMVLFALLSAVCYYFLTFWAFRFADARCAVDMFDIMSCSGRRRISIAEVSSAMGWKPESTARFVERCKKRGYFTL